MPYWPEVVSGISLTFAMLPAVPQSCLERTITVQWHHQVHFTERVFTASNPVLAKVLAGDAKAPSRTRCKALVIREGPSTCRPTDVSAQ